MKAKPAASAWQRLAEVLPGALRAAKLLAARPRRPGAGRGRGAE